MSTIELKYELFREIDSINDENLLHKISSYIKNQLHITNSIGPLYDPESRAYLNEESMQAIQESMNGSFAGEVDTTDIESFKKSLGI